MFNPTMAGAVGGVGGMVKALMDGQSQNNQQQKMQQVLAMRQAQGGAPMATARPPMPQPAGPMQGAMPLPGMGMAPGMQQPFPQAGAAPVNLDPMTKALFSPIPGATGGQ